MGLTVGPFGGAPARELPLLISAIPGAAEIDFPLPTSLPREAVLLDIAYDPWPTPLAAAWSGAGRTAVGDQNAVDGVSRDDVPCGRVSAVYIRMAGANNCL